MATMVSSSTQVKADRTSHDIVCSLCGSNGASIRCEGCNRMAFCIGCDHMYHRHPKRRHHLRKAVALEFIPPAKAPAVQPKLSMSQTSSNLYVNSYHLATQILTNSVPPDVASLYPWRRPRTLPRMPDFGPSGTKMSMMPAPMVKQIEPPKGTLTMPHPSKMPIPPPRKKKTLSFSSIKKSFSKLMGSEKSSYKQPPPPPPQYPPEPIYSTIRPVADHYGVIRKQSVPLAAAFNSSATSMTKAPLEEQNSDVDLVYENMRKETALQHQQRMRLLASYDDLHSNDRYSPGSSDREMSARKWSNFSCQDLATQTRTFSSRLSSPCAYSPQPTRHGSTQSVAGNLCAPESMYCGHHQAHHLYHQHHQDCHQQQHCFAQSHPCHGHCNMIMCNCSQRQCNHRHRPMALSSAASLEEFRGEQFEEEDNDDNDDDVSEGEAKFDRRSSLRSTRRSKNCSNMRRVQSSFSMFANLKNEEPKKKVAPGRDHQRSDCNHGGNIETSSIYSEGSSSSAEVTSMPTKQYNHAKEHFSYSSSASSSSQFKPVEYHQEPKVRQAIAVEQDDHQENDEEEKTNELGQWSCRFCTFYNEPQLNVCEICCKTRLVANKIIPKMLRQRVGAKTADRQQQVELETSRIVFDSKMVEEQRRIEQDIRQRRENEERIERENKAIEEEIARKEEEDARRLNAKIRDEEDDKMKAKIKEEEQKQAEAAMIKAKLKEEEEEKIKAKIREEEEAEKLKTKIREEEVAKIQAKLKEEEESEKIRVKVKEEIEKMKAKAKAEEDEEKLKAKLKEEEEAEKIRIKVKEEIEKMKEREEAAKVKNQENIEPQANKEHEKNSQDQATMMAQMIEERISKHLNNLKLNTLVDDKRQVDSEKVDDHDKPREDKTMSPQLETNNMLHTNPTPSQSVVASMFIAPEEHQTRPMTLASMPTPMTLASMPTPMTLASMPTPMTLASMPTPMTLASMPTPMTLASIPPTMTFPTKTLPSHQLQSTSYQQMLPPPIESTQLNAMQDYSTQYNHAGGMINAMAQPGPPSMSLNPVTSMQPEMITGHPLGKHPTQMIQSTPSLSSPGYHVNGQQYPNNPRMSQPQQPPPPTFGLSRQSSISSQSSSFWNDRMQPFSSLDDLQSMSSSMSNNSAYHHHHQQQQQQQQDPSKGQMTSGLQVIQTLKEAERRGYTADDVEVAIQFNATSPLDWLDDNWQHMCETVLTMANNQIIELEHFSTKNRDFKLVGEKDARVALRICKGNIWQAVEKCVQRHQEDKLFATTSGNKRKASLTKESLQTNKTQAQTNKSSAPRSFSLKLAGLGNGRANNDSNLVEDYDDDDEEVAEEEVENVMNPQLMFFKPNRFNQDDEDEETRSLEETENEKNNLKRRYLEQLLEKEDGTVTTNDIELLIENWREKKVAEEEELERMKYIEREKQEMKKLIDLQRRIGGGLLSAEGSSDDDDDDQVDKVERVIDEHNEDLLRKLEMIEQQELVITGPDGEEYQLVIDDGQEDEEEDRFDSIEHRMRTRLNDLIMPKDGQPPVDDQENLEDKIVHITTENMTPKPMEADFLHDTVSQLRQQNIPLDLAQPQVWQPLQIKPIEDTSPNTSKAKGKGKTRTIKIKKPPKDGSNQIAKIDENVPTNQPPTSIEPTLDKVTPIKSLKQTNEVVVVAGKRLTTSQLYRPQIAVNAEIIASKFNYAQVESYLLDEQRYSSPSLLHVSSNNSQPSKSLDVANVEPQASSTDDKPTMSSGDAKPTISSGDVKPTMSSAGAEPTISSGNLSTISSGDIAPTMASSDVGPTMSSGNVEPPKSSAGTEPMKMLKPELCRTNTPVHLSRPEEAVDFQWARTEFECELCTTIVKVADIVSMISCTHYACRDCVKQYFTIQIRERQRLVIACPFCEEPNIGAENDDDIFEYLGLFDQLVRHIVDEDVYELFQRKMRDRALMRDPSFLWCPQCSSGFISSNRNTLTVMCPDCKALTCRKCKKNWQKQHFNLTCEAFEEWEKSNNEDFAEHLLNQHLKEFGIDCPNCKFRYQLAKGGCMHFRCLQCSYDFCGGCYRPFKMGSRCFRSKICEKLGLHAHHPRNCLFYLRDKEIGDLRRMLDENNVDYKKDEEEVVGDDGEDAKVLRCQVWEQKETDQGMKDEKCNRYSEAIGLCKLHYKEYLGSLIYKHKIDPIEIFNEDELELVLRRENMHIPTQIKGENYVDKLKQLIHERLPLEAE